MGIWHVDLRHLFLLLGGLASHHARIPVQGDSNPVVRKRTFSSNSNNSTAKDKDRSKSDCCSSLKDNMIKEDDERITDDLDGWWVTTI